LLGRRCGELQRQAYCTTVRVKCVDESHNLTCILLPLVLILFTIIRANYNETKLFIVSASYTENEAKDENNSNSYAHK
jgi:hypothetical protein